ncbi:MAG TPA: right-handed parallel beta-helix repeat-containing protein [Candidatus Binatia bacterium]|jgi:hypothetical protein
MRRSFSIRLPGALAAALVVGTAPGVGALPDPFCGSMITQSVTLTADHSCDQGITVGADGITIDLGGFTLNGNNGVASGNGIDLNGRFGVTVKNGTIRHFNRGIVGDAPKKLSHLTVRDNADLGVTLSRTAVDHCAFIANGSGGLQLHGGKVTASSFVANGSFGGLYLNPQGDKITVSNVIASLNAGPGIHVTGGTHAVSIKGATCTNNTESGVRVNDATATVSKSTIVGNVGDGVDLDQSGVGFGPPGVGDVIDGNLIAGNGGIGIKLTNGSIGNSVTKNRLMGNGGTGMQGDATSAGSTIKSNTSMGNAGSGFDLSDTTSTFTKNVMDANTGDGILAAGAIDGGGNTARGNVAIDPCASVACPPPFVPGGGPFISICGMHITSSIVLDDDLGLCGAEGGLVVDADTVTIDLNGHTLNGNPTAGGIGIDVGAHTKVTIENGRVIGFDTGIRLTTGDTLKIDNVEVRSAMHDGVHVESGAVTFARSALIRNMGNGLLLGDGATAKVSTTYFVQNGADGVDSTASSGTFTKIAAIANTGAGLELAATSAGMAKIVAAIVAGNGTDGIRVGGHSAVSLTKSFLLHDQVQGIRLASEGPDTLSGNLSTGNGQNGIETFAPTSVTISKNMLLGNRADGVFLEMGTASATLTGNTAIGNMGEGLLNPGHTTITFAKNRADANHGNGIDAAGDATDGGGNTAHDNAGPNQCTGPIVCK